MAACAADVFLLANAAVALLAAAVAELPAPDAEEEAAVALSALAVAELAAAAAFCVTSVMVASVLESPVPPTPL